MEYKYKHLQQYEELRRCCLRTRATHCSEFLLYLRIEQSGSDYKRAQDGLIQCSKISVIMSSHQCPKEVILYLQSLTVRSWIVP